MAQVLGHRTSDSPQTGCGQWGLGDSRGRRVAFGNSRGRRHGRRGHGTDPGTGGGRLPRAGQFDAWRRILVDVDNGSYLYDDGFGYQSGVGIDYDLTFPAAAEPGGLLQLDLDLGLGAVQVVAVPVPS